MFTSSVAKYRASQKWREFLQKNCKTAGEGQRDEKSGIEKLAGFFFSALNKTAGNTAGENRLNSGTSCGIAKSINGKNKLVKSDLNRSKCMASENAIKKPHKSGEQTCTG